MAGISKYYIATVKYMVEEMSKTGKTSFKSRRDDYLINAESITAAETTLNGLLGGVYDNFEIVGIRESSIVGVINEVKDVFKETE
jgi:hypothetical protein